MCPCKAAREITGPGHAPILTHRVMSAVRLDRVLVHSSGPRLLRMPRLGIGFLLQHSRHGHITVATDVPHATDVCG